MRHDGLSVMRLVTDHEVPGLTPCKDPREVVCRHMWLCHQAREFGNGVR